METRQALKEQYHAGLAMLAVCVEMCPEDMWHRKAHEDVPEDEGASSRTFWRIAFHATFYTHLYLGQDEAAFTPWPGQRAGIHSPRMPGRDETYQKSEVLDYIRFVDALVDPTVDRLNLDSDESGFSWYAGISKLSHQLMNLRHVQGHVGQLSELLMARGIDLDPDWVSRSIGFGAKR